MENSWHKSPHLCPSLCTNYACRLGHAGHTVSNTTPVDNSTVAAGSLVVQPSLVPPFVSERVWCLQSKKDEVNAHNIFTLAGPTNKAHLETMGQNHPLMGCPGMREELVR